MKKILQNKLYLTLFASDMVSNFGDVMYYLALMNYVLLIPNTKIALSIVSLSETLPIFASLVTGYLSDRTPDKIRRIKMTQLFRFALYLVIGFVMSFTPALWIVIVASLFNVFSDLAGQYESGLFMPLNLRVVADEDRETFMAFGQSAALILNIIFRSVSAFLVGLLSYSFLGYINAGTFLLSFTIMLAATPKLKELLLQKPIKTEAKAEQASSKSLLSGMKDTLTLTIAEVKRVPEFRLGAIYVPILNALLAVINVILVLIISADPHFVIFSPAVTLSISTISLIAGSVIGGLLIMSVLKDVTIYSLLKWASWLTLVLFVSLTLHQIYLYLLSNFLLGIVVGAVNPKFSALFYRYISEENLATVNGGFSLFCQIGMVVSQFLVSILVLFLSGSQISLIFLIFAVFLLIYSLKNSSATEMMKEEEKELEAQ